MFSIVIPLYNKELSVQKTIQSVLDQTFQEFEIVIVNDGSTDNSAEIVSQINDSRIRLLHQENQGVSAARNNGIKEAKYDWIALLDGDDLWLENHLSTLKEMIDSCPKDKVFTTSFIRSYQTIIEDQDNSIEVIENYFRGALKSYVTCSITICVHNEVFDKVGGFNIKLNRGEDLDLWARIGRKYRYIKSNRITAVYMVDAENKLTTGRSVYNKSILSVINLKGLKGEERRYFKRMINRRLKSNIKVLAFSESIKILKQHKIELFN